MPFCRTRKGKTDVGVGYVDLFKYASKKEKWLVVLALACAFVAGVLYSGAYIVSCKIYNSMVTNPVDSRAFLVEGYTYVAIDVIMVPIAVGLTFAHDFILRRVCLATTARIKVAFLASLVRQNASWLASQKAGALNARLTQDIELLSDGIGSKLAIVFRIIGAALCWVASSFVADWRATLICLPGYPIGIAMMVYMLHRMKQGTADYQKYADRSAAIMQEALVHVRTVKCCNGEDELTHNLESTLRESEKQAAKSAFWNGILEGGVFFEQYIFYMAGTYICGINLIHGFNTPGDVLMVPAIFFLVTFYTCIHVAYIKGIARARVGAKSLYDIIEREPIYVTKSTQQLHISAGRIDFEDVVFGYNADSPVLKGLSFTAHPGQTLALVGHSGCGKSTSALLLTRMYDAQKGYVRIDGQDISQCTVESVRRQMGIVQQEPVLFSGTIAENVALGDKSISRDQVEAACRTAHAHDFIQRLPHGYDTVIGFGGIQLSGGQKQRVAIARAIVSDPRILLLDEATSALDTHSEVMVQAALNAACAGRTTIVIAHRLSTIRDADQIVVIEGGAVVEKGSHDELLAVSGRYAALAYSQDSESNEPFEPATELITKEDEALADILPEEDEEDLASDTAADEDTALAHSERRKTGFLLLYRNLMAGQKPFIVAMIATFIRGLEIPFYVVFYKVLTDALQNTSDIDAFINTLLFYSATCIVIGFASFVSLHVATSRLVQATLLTTNSIKVAVLRSLLRKPVVFFDNPHTTSGKVIARVNREAPRLATAMDTRVMHLFSNLVAMLILFVMGLFYEWRIIVPGGALVACVTLIIRFTSKKSVQITTAANRNCNTGNLSVEIIENLKTIQLLSKESHFVSKYADALSTTNDRLGKAIKWDCVAPALGLPFNFYCDAVSFAVTLILVHNGELSPSTGFIAAMCVTYAGLSMQFGCLGLTDFANAQPAAESLLSLVDDVASDSSTPETDARFEKIEGHLAVDNVTFAYPRTPDLLVANGLTFSIPAGKTVALVGPSGSGKSTIMLLLERLYDRLGGSIAIDGIGIDDIPVRSLRRQLGVVGQEPVLFSGSVIDNVRLGVPDASVEDVIEACRMANAAAFVEKLPAGYDTEVGEKGAMLSGGQKQRIAIARAIVRRPAILLLDEATSALDTESERVVQAALDVATSTRRQTCVVIAHRLSSIRNADLICFVDKGKIIETGTYDQLVAANGRFADLVKKQGLQRT